MSGFNGQVTPIQSQALWSWNTSGAAPVAMGFSPGGATQPTKTGLMPGDLQNFIGIPLQYYGNPPQAVSPSSILQWLRWAEDYVERETGLLLCQSWVAAPPAVLPGSPLSIAVEVTGSGGQQQQLGLDYDVYDAAYDFFFPRAQDEGWMNYSLRYRPVRSVAYDMTDYNAIKRLAYIYPLLNEFFQVPPSWLVTDEDKGMVRLVPATNVQMLPLFALQLSFMGFADSVPGGLWFQYTAGLTANDYNSRYNFIKQLVLAQASITALQVIQGTINLGALATTVHVDGLSYHTQYSVDGPYSGMIKTFTKMRDELIISAKSKVSGPMFTVF
ncbi:MAG TPA: hypothetical protein VNG91_05240 [Terriglobia bacterium]|nr:hypothetical protein [Terriglobia bacterium]